jgi:transposase InsO family protein
MTREGWREAQSQDPSINRVIKLVESAQKPSFKNLSDEQPEVKLLLREWNKLELREGILYRRCFDRGDMIHQLVLPEQHKDRALQGLHDEVGHLGAERVLSLARARFYWPRMKESIEKKCQTCERCFRRKAQPQKAAPMVNIRTTYPFELVCMDYLSLEPDSHDTRNILVITDHFTKFAVAVPTKDQKARTVAKALWENFLVHYGFPSRLHSDQGRDFESRKIRELCSLIGAEKVRTTPYHPQGNPVERFNRTLLSMLGTLEDKDKQHWRDFVKPLVHAYNCTINDTTGYSPYELMFGRQPTLPVDLILGIDNPNETHKTHSEYVQNLRQRLQESYTLAALNSKKAGERNKLRFDAKVRAAELVEGDRVLIRNVNIRGKHKLADKWEKSIHIVVKRFDGGPVYVVKPERGSGPHRTLHRDLLLPCGFLPVEKTPEQGPRLDKAKKMPLRSGKRRDLQTENDNSEGNLTDEEEETYLFEGPPQFATWGPYVQEIESTLQRQPLIPLNPEAPEFSTQHSLTSNRMTSDQSVKPPELLIETSSDVDQPFPQSREHVVVDIPECDMSREEERNRNVSPNRKDNDTTLPNQHHDIVSQEPEEDLNVIPESRLSEPRRSHRERHQPHKLTYDELGKPLILAICSLIGSLQDILSPVSSNHYQVPSRV